MTLAEFKSGTSVRKWINCECLRPVVSSNDSWCLKNEDPFLAFELCHMYVFEYSSFIRFLVIKCEHTVLICTDLDIKWEYI